MLKNKKLLFIIIISIILVSIVLVINLYNLHNEKNIENIEKNEKPIITLFKSVGTTTYQIKYYDKYAIHRSDIGGIAGMSENGKRIIRYDRKIDFDEIKEKIEEILSNDVRTNMYIYIDENPIYVTDEYEVVKELLEIVNVQDITDIGRI